MKDLSVAQVCSSRIEAEILKGMLEAHGIPSMIMSDDAGGAYSFLLQGGFSGVKLLVKSADLKQAKKLINESA